MKSAKRILSLALVVLLMLSLYSPYVTANENARGVEAPIISKEHEASLNSLLNQLSTTGIGILEDAGGQAVLTPSGIDPSVRVSYQIITPGRSGYEASENAVIKFSLNKSSNDTVSFSYTLLSGSAFSFINYTDTSGTISFESGETEKTVTIEIPLLVNKPTNSFQPSDPSEFWKGERILYIMCRDIQNALFEDNTESMTVPVPIKNNYDYEQAYLNATQTYIADLSELIGAESTGTPGKYSNAPDPKITLRAPITGNIRAMIDTGVFSHIQMPTGYFLNESGVTGSVWFETERIIYLNTDPPTDPPTESSFTEYTDSMAVDAMAKIDFALGELELSEVGLGHMSEDNGMAQALNFVFDYSSIAGTVYTCFMDQSDTYSPKQVRFLDKIAPYVYSVDTPTGISIHHGDKIPVKVTFNEPVYNSNIRIKIDGETYLPLEQAGTISETITFLYEIKEDYSGSITISDITGATDLSGRPQQEFNEQAVVASLTFNPKKAFEYCAQPSVDIIQGDSLNATGTITVNMKDYLELSNWLSDYLEDLEEGTLLSVVKARVSDSEGSSIDVPLYTNIEGGQIKELTGKFNAPVNSSDQPILYVVEFYFDSNATGDFSMLYGLSEEYSISPIIFINDASDLEIQYTSWPSTNSIFTDNRTPLSLYYRIKIDATWQRPEDFSWTSSNTDVASISPEGIITMTGNPGTVFFTLTATNAGNSDIFTLSSRTLTVAEAQDTFLLVPASMQSIETQIGNDAKVYYSTNIPERNDTYTGSTTSTVFTFNLYEAKYIGESLQKGDLKHSEEHNISAETSGNFISINNEYLLNTSSKGTYSYILEISARELESDTVHVTNANICVKPLPAKAVLTKPASFYLTDDTNTFPVSFDVENVAAGIEYLLTVKKNNEATPVFSTNAPSDLGSIHNILLDNVDDVRLFDAYTVSLKAKNEFDESYSFDSYILYVYNADALKIAVNGMDYTSYTLKPDQDFPNMTGTEIYNYFYFNDISFTEYVSINKSEYRWSNIADKITWEVGDAERLTLKFDGQYIGGDSATQLLPGAVLALEGLSSGSSYIKATHALTGMETTLDITVEDIRDKVYLFRSYPSMECEITYKNGYGIEKTVVTPSDGSFGIYESSGISSDVTIRPLGDDAYVYDCAVLPWHKLRSNQRSSNLISQYPRNIITMPKQNFNLTLELYNEDTGEPYTGDIIIRGGVRINGEFRWNYDSGYIRYETTINGKMGDTDQTVVAENGLYTLVFDPTEFTDGYGRLSPLDQLEYIIEVKHFGNSHYPQYIKVDNETIRKSMKSPMGVYQKKSVRPVDPTMIQNNVIVVSETLNIDGKETSFSDNIVLTSEPKSITVSLDMILTEGFHGSSYTLRLSDKDTWFSPSETLGTLYSPYEFSDTVVLSGTLDLKPLLKRINPGQKLNLYPSVIKGDGLVQLPKPLKLQKLYNIPNMSEIYYRSGGVPSLRQQLSGAIYGSYNLDFNDDDELVGQALDILSHFSGEVGTYRFEIIPTDDPLVYKSIIRFAAGEYTRENPSGIFVAGDNSIDYNFMPGYSDIKEMSKGEYLKKSKAEMQKAKNGSSGYYKSYGGGAYMECEIRYDVKNYVWRINLLKSDMYVGGGITYYYTYNGWVAFIPVTATFKTGMTGELGLKTVYDSTSGKRAYITELRPYFYTYGFGGAGFDYDIVALKAGPYGIISHEQRYLWYNCGDDERNGQKLTISGKVGLEFKIKLLFAEVSGKYELGRASKSWTYNDFNDINNVFSSGRVLSMLSSGASEVIDESSGELTGTVTFEDRTYLDGAKRYWGTTPMAFGPLSDSSVGILSSEPPTVLLSNAYPYSNPMLIA